MAKVESNLTLGLTSQGALTAPLWTPNHTTANGNYYTIGTLVKYETGGVSYIYKCIADNDSIIPTNVSYWLNMGVGNTIQQEKPDWNATSGDSQILNKPDLTGYISEAPNDGSQYVRKNEAWDKLTTYSAVNPVSTNNVAGGYPLGSDWFNTITGEKFYHKANGVWISYTSSTTPPTPGGDSPVMFADYATQTFLPNVPTYYNGLLDDGVGATLTSGSDGKLYGIVGSALQPLLYGQTVLVKDENPGDFESGMPSNRPHNGVYIVTNEGSNNVIGVPDSPWVLTRVDYADEPNELYPSQVNILSGVNENRFFLQKNVISTVGTEEVEYEINYVPPTQVVTLPVIHMDTVTTAPLPSCTYMDEFPPSIPGVPFYFSPTTSYLTATVNGPLGVINGVNVTNSIVLSNRKILVKNQADNKQNGDYEIIQNGSVSQPWKLRRITTTYSSFNKNTREWKINNELCTLYGNRYYMNYNNTSIGTIGTTPITFSELSAVPSLSLQSVTNVGNSTTNALNVQLGDDYSIVNRTNVTTESDATGAYAFIENTGKLGINSGDFEGTIQANNLTTNNVNLEFPQKSVGSYTIATTDDLALKADLVAGKVPSSQLPSYVDDVIEGYYSAPTFYSNAGLTTPIVPETGKIYVDLLQNKSYRWSGSVYIQISNAISSIDELTDVTVTSPLNGQLLQYNLTTNQWENQSIVVGTGDMQTSTYDIDNDGIVDFAETVPVVVRNNSVTDILRKGTIVYLNGSTGFRPNAFKAQANAEATSSGTFGVVLEDIATNTDGTVAMLGTMHTLDTRNAATGAPYPFTNDILLDGDVLWLSPTDAGYVTKTKPQAPNHAVFIGVVARSHPSLGRIVYRITNGYELDELHNVFINGTLADKHTLYYDAATSLWKTNTIEGILGFNPAQLLTAVTVDANIGSRLRPADAASNGFYFNKSFNGSVGYTALNTNTGNSAVVNLGVGIDSSSYIKNIYVAKFGPNYFVPLLAGKGGLLGTEEVFVGSTDNNDVSILTGVDFSSVSRKFTVKANGQLLIQTTPATGSTSDSVLVRDSSGNVKQVAYPSVGVPLTRQEFIYSGAQTFTLSTNPSYTYAVFVNGQELNSSQYTVTTNVLTILNTLQIVNGNPDSVNIVYAQTTPGVLDYYTKAQVDALLLGTGGTTDINIVNATKITLMYNT